MGFEIPAQQFEIQPSRPAPVRSFEPSQRVIDALAALQPKIVAVKETTASSTSNTMIAKVYTEQLSS